MSEYKELLRQVPEIEERLGYIFKNKNILMLAFVHSSYVNENKEIIAESNERLEFLGDAILGLLIADHLFHQLPEESEGALSLLRSKLIESSTCSQFLKKLDIEHFILMGKGEKKSFLAKSNNSIMADLLEALIGAIYIDGGLKSAKEFLFSNFKEEIEELINSPMRNWKAELQDYSQRKYQKVPVYKVIDEVGPDHHKMFTVSVFIDDIILGSGYGSSKKLAQQAAAAEALCRLNTSENQDQAENET